VKHTSRIAGLIGGSFVSASCAVGYGVGYTSGSVAADVNPRSGIAEDGPANVSTAYQEFRLIDTTGLLLAALVNAGRQHNARAEAIEAAQYRRPDSQGKITVEYSYEPMPILAGLLTDMRIRVPLGAPSLELGGMKDPRELNYWAFDVRPEFYTFRPVKTLPLVASLFMNLEVEQWKAPTPGGVDFSLLQIDMGVGGAASYVIGENLVATSRLTLGVLSPLFAALGGGSKLNPSAEVEVGWRPFHTSKVGVQVSGVAYLGREFAVGRSVVEPRAGLNVAFTFGTQTPKRKPAIESTPVPPATAISGVVCVGPEQPPECMQLVNTLPEPAKTLFVACATATVTAVENKQFDAQPAACRTAGQGIAKFAANDGKTLDDTTRRHLSIAAATSFDFAAAGFEVSTGKLGAEHCAMIESTFNHVLGYNPSNPALPTKVKVVNYAVSLCREKFTCTSDADQLMTCVPKS
jgi:hypothetical protein